MLVFLWVGTLLSTDIPLPVAGVSASSETESAPARALVDGDRETSWQPDADGAYGIGQWIRVDFGRVVDVTAITLHNGIQRKIDGVDQFCHNARAGKVMVYGDSAHVPSLESDDLNTQVYRTQLGKWGFHVPLRTRYLTIVIDGTEVGFAASKSVALAELEVFGKPAADHVLETGDVVCGSRRLAQVRDAVVSYCATHYRVSRPNAECSEMRAQFDFCVGDPPSFLPIPATTFESGKLALSFKSANPPFPKLELDATREPDGRWVVASLTCTRANKTCGPKHTVASDGDRTDYEVSVPKRCKASDGTTVAP